MVYGTQLTHRTSRHLLLLKCQLKHTVAAACRQAGRQVHSTHSSNRSRKHARPTRHCCPRHEPNEATERAAPTCAANEHVPPVLCVKVEQGAALHHATIQVESTCSGVAGGVAGGVTPAAGNSCRLRLRLLLLLPVPERLLAGEGSNPLPLGQPHVRAASAASRPCRCLPHSCREAERAAARLAAPARATVAVAVTAWHTQQ